MERAGLAAAMVEPPEIYRAAYDGYQYLYPLVMMDATRRTMTNVPPDQLPLHGPMNSLVHAREFPSLQFRDVVRPNFDTLYSSAWLDLRREPVVVAIPDTRGRYYLSEYLDMWTEVFAAPGKRRTGTMEQRHAIAAPGWTGTVPAGVELIRAPTPYVWLINRIQTSGPSDYPSVHAVQDSMRIAPLSGLDRATAPGTSTRIDPTVDMRTPPLQQVNALPAATFFAYAAELLRLHPPHTIDGEVLTRLAAIGIRPGAAFSTAGWTAPQLEALDRGAADALQEMRQRSSTMGQVANGWNIHTESIGRYGTNYLKRAVVAMVGLGANLPEDAVYPIASRDETGRPLSGAQRYVLHFGRQQLPPAHAFWSATVYDDNGFTVGNPIDRAALGDRDPLALNPDGSLDLLIQHERPAPEHESNWLPAPLGPFNVTLRLYDPDPVVLDGRWVPPPISRLPAVASGSNGPTGFEREPGPATP